MSKIKMKIDKLKLSNEIRRECIRIITKGKGSHVGSCLSCVEIMVALYTSCLNVDPKNPNKEDRDRLIISKGHAAAVVYATLAHLGFFPKEYLDRYYQNDGLPGHVTINHVPGIEASTGSLGHGLSIAAGMALAAKKDNKKFRVFCLLSDGECDEGSIWEAAIFSASHSLDNLIAIIDYNKLQAMGKTEDIFKLEPFYDKWRAFGWSVREVDGHNIKQLEDALKNVPFDKDKPSCVIAHTIKGKGVSFMENNILWHYRTPDDFEFKKAINELKDKY